MSTAELETTEGYKEYSITVMVRRLEDKTFTAVWMGQKIQFGFDRTTI